MLYLSVLHRAVWDARGIGIVPSDGERAEIIRDAREWLTTESDGLREICEIVNGAEVAFDSGRVVRVRCEYEEFLRLNRARFKER